MIKQILTLAFSLLVGFAHAQVNIITTIAGTSMFGYDGDNGPATNAKLKAPYRICTDRANNIYIADAYNNRIRKVDAITNEITTIAGTGVPGYNGDNIPATDAQLFVPQAIVSDEFDNLYVCDGLNHRIRKITASGIITTIAGNGLAGSIGDGTPATNAELNEPTGVFVDKAGNVFIADWGNNKIRKINTSNGIITTIAGTGVADCTDDSFAAISSKLNGPLQISLDKSGNIIIAEQYCHRVRKIDAAGIITTIAGTGQVGYSGNGGLATNAELNEPTGLFIDDNNCVYVAEYGNGTVRKIDSETKKITAVAGTGRKGFDEDGSPATTTKLACSDVLLDRHGNLIIADYENNRIRKITSALKVTDLNTKELLSLYPNPTIGRFVIDAGTQNADIAIYNMAGMQVYHNQTTSISTKTEIDITSQPPGTYMVYVQSGEDRYASKVVLNK